MPDDIAKRAEGILADCSEPGWDSYGAAPVDKRALDAAVDFAQNLWLGPTNNGGAALEDQGGDLTFIIEFLPDGRLEGLYFKSGDWEFEVERPADG